MRLRIIPPLRPAFIPPNQGFSIGGWNPFGGGVVGILEGGTINGQTVFSGGLAGVAQHLDEVAQGVNTSILGGTIGSALNDLVVALDAPVINAANWIDKHKTAVITVVAIVGIAILAPYAYAAWTSELGTDAADAAVEAEAAATEAESAPVELETAADVAPDLLSPGVVGEEATLTAPAELETAATLAPETAPAELETEATLAPDLAPATEGTAATLGSTGLGASATSGLSGIGGQILGTAASSVLGPLAGALVGDVLGTKKPATVPTVTTPVASSSTWLWVAAALGVLLLMRRGD